MRSCPETAAYDPGGAMPTPAGTAARLRRVLIQLAYGFPRPQHLGPMKLYGELAEWWPIFSSPEEYRDEAEFFARALIESCDPAPRRVLELGSGGGNNAFHLKARFAMTLVDQSPHMLAVSQALNPECEHVEGDIRTVRLGRTFDAVFVHDAICHMTTEADLLAVMETAFEHLRAGRRSAVRARPRARNFCRGHRSRRQRHRPGQRALSAMDHRSRSPRHDIPGRLRDPDSG